MSDITSRWDTAAASADWVLNQLGSDLVAGDNLATAVINSLFTDRISNLDDNIAPYGGDPRGWIGDLGEEYPIGSRIWLLMREKLSQATANLAKDYVKEALQWMIDDGVIASFTIATEVQLPRQLNMHLTLYQMNGLVIAYTFSRYWAEMM